MYATTTPISAHDFGLTSDVMHFELNKGGLVEYLVSLGSHRDHDVGGVHAKVVSFPRGSWVSHVTHRRIIGYGGPERWCGGCVGFL